MTQSIQKKWLKVTAVGIACFGPVMFFGTMDSTNEAARLSMDFLAWPIDGAEQIDNSGSKLLSALLGGFLFGWGMMIWFLSDEVYDAAPEKVRKAVLIGVLSWFFLDSAGSIAGGNASNAFFNVPILFFLVGPLWVAERR